VQARIVRQMPFLDRYWWLRVLLGGALLIAALLFALWYHLAAAPVDLRFGQFGVSNAILAAETILIFVYAAFISLWRSQQARTCRARRLEAMAGDREAVPLARSATDLVKEEDSGAPPWQFSFPTSSVVWTVAGRAFFLLAYGSILTLLFRNLQLLLTLDGPLTLFYAKSQTPAPGLLAVVPFLVMLLAPVAPASDSPTSAGDQQLGTCLCLCVNEEGIQWSTRSGREHCMKWTDIPLFEVMHQSTQAQQHGPRTMWRISILYAGDQALWWRERASENGGLRSPRFAHLARFIKRKTLLQPRTFDPLLMATAQPTQNKGAHLARWAILLVAVYLPIILFMATRGAQLAIGGSILFGALLVFSLYFAARASTVPAQESLNIIGGFESTESQLDAISHVYEMRASASWFERARVIGILVGAGLSLLAAVGLTYGLLELVSANIRRITDPSNLIWPSAIVGGVAALSTIAQIRSRATIVRADATGLIQDGPVWLASIPWNGVISIERHDTVNPPFYQVESDVGYTVKWPMQTPKALSFTPSEGASLVEPERLAELVSLRSGVPITTPRAQPRKEQRTAQVTQ
jgi:hypothetical protein